MGEGMQVVTDQLDVKYVEELKRIAEQKDACEFILQAAIRQIEDRFHLLQGQQDELWARIRKDYHLDDNYVYQADTQRGLLLCMGRADKLMTPGRFR